MALARERERGNDTQTSIFGVVIGKVLGHEEGEGKETLPGEHTKRMHRSECPPKESELFMRRRRKREGMQSINYLPLVPGEDLFALAAHKV